jgi:hypothetical protein
MDFSNMPWEHAILIPCVLLVGGLVGYVLGARAVRNQLERQKQRMKE